MDLRDKKTFIKFYNGMTTIGGTYIQVSYEDSRIIFDFGAEFDPSLKEEPEKLKEILKAGLVPYIPGVFDRSIKLDGFSRKEEDYETFKNTAVFLSHLHLDHSKMINYLDPQIPLYTTDKTKKLLRVLNINENFLFKSENDQVKILRDVEGLDDGQSVQLGRINVEIIEVDHDAYGAAGLLITTPDMKIAYTGDIRLHGFRKEDTLNFCKKAKNADVLIIEGVSVSFKDFDDGLEATEFESEEALVNKIAEVIENNDQRQIIFNYYISNIERLLRLKKRVKRKIVLTAYNAYSIYELTGLKLNYYLEDDGLRYGLDEDYEVSVEDLFKDRLEYFWQFKKSLFDRVDDLQEGCLYIHTDAVPLGEFDPKYEAFVKMFKKRDIDFLRLSCSGHAFPRDLLKIIDLIEPKLLVPIHSQKPEKLYNINGDRLLPKRNQRI